MKILLVGGCLKEKCTGGDTNVVKSIAHIYTRENDVYIFPYLPVIQNCLPICDDGITIVDKKISLNILIYCVRNILSWGRVVVPYLSVTPRGLSYYLITLFNRAVMEEKIKNNIFNVIHVHGISIDSMPFIHAAFDHERPIIVTVHGLNSLDKNNSLHFKQSLEKHLVLKLATHNVPITAVSSAAKNEMVKNFSVDADMIKIVLNGVNFKKFNKHNVPTKIFREEYNIPKNKFVFLQVGNLNQRKNHIAVLDAIAKMDLNLRCKLYYIIVGMGIEYKNLEKFVTNNNLESSVMFMGRVPDDQLVKIYGLSDFFILPSTSEGLPLVFLEAMAAGLPIITFADLEGVGDIYNPDCMKLISDRSKNAIINSIQYTIEKRWDRVKIKKNAQEYTWEQICDQYIKIYEELM